MSHLFLLQAGLLGWPLADFRWMISSVWAETLSYPPLGPQAENGVCPAPCVLVTSGRLINNRCLSGFQSLLIHGNFGPVSFQKSKPNFPRKTANFVGKEFHNHLNEEGFQCHFHLEFLYIFQVLGGIPVFNCTP